MYSFNSPFATDEDIDTRSDLAHALEAFALASVHEARAQADLGGIQEPDEDKITQDSPPAVLRAHRAGQLAHYARQRLLNVIGAVAFEIATETAARCLPVDDDDAPHLGDDDAPAAEYPPSERDENDSASVVALWLHKATKVNLPPISIARTLRALQIVAILPEAIDKHGAASGNVALLIQVAVESVTGGTTGKQPETTD